ncbi:MULTISPECIES: hypothetical protein [Pseudomonas]|jgi:hypothetical protein|uniref:Uncharacterized protein n=1 Tax=Pseudomonas frederiksbergensis TaxID=104087 RepID=A0A0B1YXP7_9PSED|nr:MULTISPECIES: hypothetical protein [Pseudomonas]KHK63170.1 hypothetical protein JZ00_18785 [Pseudomonas frederiksbergensis]KJH86719.1 hypothetical protein UG46_09740 [Pseudomonas fluorescens]WRV70192.1 hypothetical protein VQ575_09210 [Pseudomonas frederiksbergensis]
MTNEHSKGHTPVDNAAPAKDATGAAVPVVERDVHQPDPATDKVDRTITPKSIKGHEQDAEKLQDKVAQVEKKLDR